MTYVLPWCNNEQYVIISLSLKHWQEKIHRENHVRFLGVLLDSSTLSWKTHFTELSKKLSGTVGLFCKIRHYVPQDTLILLYDVDWALCIFSLIWNISLGINPIGLGGQNGPPRVLAKYLRNGFADLHETLGLLRQLYRSSFNIKSLRTGHSLLPWQPINGGGVLC